MICPRCNGQGVIYQALVDDKNLIIYLCDECEATWLDENCINSRYFLDFTTFMRTLGYKGLWSELKQITESWNDGDNLESH